MAVGIAPPRPTPVRKRSQVSDGESGLSAEPGWRRRNTTIDDDEHRLAAVAIGERPDRKRADHQAEQAGGEQRSQLGDREAPLRADRRRDEADDRRVEAVDGDDQETQEQQPLLHGRQRLRVDELLDVDDARDLSVVATVVLGGIGHLRQGVAPASSPRSASAARAAAPGRVESPGSTCRRTSWPAGDSLSSLRRRSFAVDRGRIQPFPSIRSRTSPMVDAIEIDHLRQPGGVDAGVRANRDQRGVLHGGEVAAAFLGEMRRRDLMDAADEVAGHPGERFERLPAVLGEGAW